MPKNNGRPHDLIPLDEIEEKELRRSLLAESRTGDTMAQARLYDLYGVRISSREPQ